MVRSLRGPTLYDWRSQIYPNACCIRGLGLYYDGNNVGVFVRCETDVTLKKCVAGTVHTFKN